MPFALGCIADDYTGGSDIASILRGAGARTLLVFGEGTAFDSAGYDAVVIALKSRSVPADDAAAWSLSAARALKKAGAEQIYFKYCSTFDSTDAGNIGPVTDALMDELGAGFTIACPSFPDNLRTVYQGHLFVGGQLLSDTHMRHHPLNPMEDSNLVAVLRRQTDRAIGLIDLQTVRQGPSAIRDAADALKKEGIAAAILDAVNNDDIGVVAEAFADAPLLTGGSALAGGLPACWRANGQLRGDHEGEESAPDAFSRPAVLSGSCSARTLEQIAAAPAWMRRYPLRPEALKDKDALLRDLAAWLGTLKDEEAPLIYASADEAGTARFKALLGAEDAGRIIEEVLAEAAKTVRAEGYNRIIVAGGETSGAVLSALHIDSAEVGASIAPGVPILIVRGEAPIALVAKSGNFGDKDFFEAAARITP